MSTETLTPAEVAQRSEQVAPRLREHLLVTPLVPFAAFSEELGAEVLVKCEHQQRTGSFKARGAMAKILTLTAEQRQRGVVTASTGNHGLGVSNALATLGGRGIIYVPETASASKVAAIKRFGVEVRSQGTDQVALELLAREQAAEQGMTYVSPYNDPDVVAGQGTIGVEIIEQLAGQPLDAIFVAVGGGGLISGIAAALKERRPEMRVYGAQPARDAAMFASVQAGQVVPVDGRGDPIRWHGRQCRTRQHHLRAVPVAGRRLGARRRGRDPRRAADGDRHRTPVDRRRGRPGVCGRPRAAYRTGGQASGCRVLWRQHLGEHARRRPQLTRGYCWAVRELVVLGTGSQVASRERSQNGYFLRWDTEGFLFDPGEGTQRQMLYAGVAADCDHPVVRDAFPRRPLPRRTGSDPAAVPRQRAASRPRALPGIRPGLFHPAPVRRVLLRAGRAPRGTDRGGRPAVGRAVRAAVGQAVGALDRLLRLPVDRTRRSADAPGPARAVRGDRAGDRPAAAGGLHRGGRADGDGGPGQRTASGATVRLRDGHPALRRGVPAGRPGRPAGDRVDVLVHASPPWPGDSVT